MRRSAYLIVATAAVSLIGGALAMARSYYTLRQWQPVAARVLAADVTAFSRGGANRFRGEITIRYSVEDQFHIVPKSLAASHSTEAEARAEINQYAPGTSTRVFYNPENPNDMLLDLSGVSRFFLLPGILALAGLAMGLYSMLLIYKMGICLCPGCATSVEVSDKFCYACHCKLPKQRRVQ